MKRAAIVALACAWFVAAALRHSDSLIDDAYIVLRYADHVVAGQGPVFNPGERVEGFSSPAWLLLVTAARACGIPGEAAVTGLGIVFGVASILAAWRLARRVASPWPSLLAPLVLAFDPAYAMWSVHGLETALAVALVAAAFWAWAGEGDRAAFLAGLLLGDLFWTRPEAPLFVGILAMLALARGEKGRALRLVAGFALLAVPLEAARFLYYGALVPNTFLAKTGGGLGRVMWGLGYARRFVVAYLPLVAASGAVALSARRLATRPPALVVDALACGAAWSIWVVWIGGDAFPGFRFWVPVVPLAVLVAVWLLGRSRHPVVLGAVAVVWIAVAARPEAIVEYETGKEFTGRMKATGIWLRDHAPKDTTIALNYVGAVPYESGLRAIDMLGLTDPAVARAPIRGKFRYPGHARGNGASILDRAPELILMGGVHLSSEPPAQVPAELDSEEQIAADPRYPERYEQVQVTIPTPAGPRWLTFCKRKDVAWTPDGAKVSALRPE